MARQNDRHFLPANGRMTLNSVSGQLSKIATLNIIFSRTADCIATKFCMTIKKFKPNAIFQNCVHSTSTLPDRLPKAKVMQSKMLWHIIKHF